MRKFFGRNWFLFGIALALILGFAIPEVGIAVNRDSIASTTLIVLLFLISGLKLPTESILKGISQIRLHLYVQGFIFVLVPIYFFATARFFGSALNGTLLIGFYALAALPTTVSSCIIFTQSAEGNVVGTMFNAALANAIGVFLSPIILSLMLRSAGGGLPISELTAVLGGLALKMLLPIAVGQFVRRYARDWIDGHKKPLSVTSNIFVLTILHFAFAKTAANPEIVQSIDELVLPFLYLAASHIILIGAAFGGAKILKFDRADRVTVLFAAPQKTLAMGVPLLSTFFGAESVILGPALLPLIFYHAWQLLVAGIVVRMVGTKT